jgi:hypothetical protein
MQLEIGQGKIMPNVCPEEGCSTQAAGTPQEVLPLDIYFKLFNTRQKAK